MSTGTKIEWCDATWNPIVGCSKISPGCQHCYAETMAGRLAAMGQAKYRAVVALESDGTVGRSEDGVKWHGLWNGHTYLDAKALTAPLRWHKASRIFVTSMGDLFHGTVPDAWLDQVFAVMALRPDLTFMLLTKRPGRAKAYFDRANTPGMIQVEQLQIVGATAMTTNPREVVANWLSEHPMTWPLPNVQLGVTAENQAAADERIPLLLATPAAVRFVSYEPALGPITFHWATWDATAFKRPHTDHLDGLRMLDGIIAGGESGQGARQAHPDWFRQVRDQCAAAGTPFFFKQWGEWCPLSSWPKEFTPRPHSIGPNRTVYACPDGTMVPVGQGVASLHDSVLMTRIGKKAAGRLLDGREHNDLPGGNA